MAANGCLAFSVSAFRNSLVYHKIDYLSSLQIHAGAMLIMTHIRWTVMPEQAHLPVSQQKFFAFDPWVSDPEEFLSVYIYGPCKLYFLWLAIYSLLTFMVCHSCVMDGSWDSTWNYFKGVKFMQKIIAKRGLIIAPIYFLFYHFCFYFSCHLFSLLLIVSMELNYLMCAIWIMIACYNGANFYMESFSRKYEKQLSKLEQFERNVQEVKKEVESARDKKVTTEPDKQE